MTVITGALGLHAAYRIKRGGVLVSQTYDGSLMAINYARAAASDFALMQLTASRLMQTTDDRQQAQLDAQLGELRRSLREDLAIASERSQSPRASQSAMRVEAAIDAWDAARQEVGTARPRSAAKVQDAPMPGAPDGLALLVQAVNREVDLLINYTAGDGFRTRQQAQNAIQEAFWLNVMALVAALLLSAWVTWLLAQHIGRQVAVASEVASRIAQGELDGAMPDAGRDELGGLIRSLAAMRESLRGMMQREVSLRQSAQGRLFDAMESCEEGIVVVDRGGRIILANHQALSTLGWGDVSAAPAEVRAVIGVEWQVLSAKLPSAGAVGEVHMPDGRWLHISRSGTREGGFVAVIGDVTAFKDQEARLEAINSRLDTALANMSQGLCLFDSNGRLIVVNARYSEIFSLPAGSVRLGSTILELIALRARNGQHLADSVEKLVLEKMTAVERRVPASFSMTIAGGRVLSVLLRPASNGGWAATYEDVTDRRRAEEKVVFMAQHDGLTLLPNRSLFADRLQQAVQVLERGRTFAVLCLDLDQFKVVNDTLGHAMGDLLLRTVGERLQSCVRAGDTVARIGGDEFTIIQAAPQSEADIMALARRIIDVISQPFDLDGMRATVGVSIGIAVAPVAGRLPDLLLRNADMALYRAKASGRGTWRFFEPDMDASIRARRALGSDLRNALADEAFELHYQAIYDLHDGRLAGFEALLRWDHPVHGTVPPGEFIPIAEELGIMVPLGQWVLNRACQDAAKWPGHVSVAVNVSPAQFRTDKLSPAVSDALQRAGLKASRLILEMTETVLLTNSAATLESMQELRAMGVRISLDDFGTGYSSLSYLESFPIDQIKIDQSFIRKLSDPGAELIVRAIIGLASNLSMRVVAEGVETAEQLGWLRDECCDAVQGYLLALPARASDLEPVMRRRIADHGTEGLWVDAGDYAAGDDGPPQIVA